MKLKTLYSLFFLFALVPLHAQIVGKVSTLQGEPLPYASVYVEGSTNGTTTNANGEYSLLLEKGTYSLVFQYIGYKQKTEKVSLTGKAARLDVQLEAETIELGTIEVKANSEDPAYPIIRQAIKKRAYYSSLVPSFSCDVYMKGNVKVLEAPEKLLGQDVGDLDGNLDTNRQGIVYLSESVSKLYFKQPDRFKEVMQSSKVSGNNQGFSFNSAQDMDIDLQKNFSEFGRQVISPIADGAMSYYRYRLIGSFVENGRLVNKIEVIPKRSDDPVFRGHIYIVDGLWNLHSTDVFVTGPAALMPLFDTFFVKQVFVPVAQPDTWRIFSQRFSMIGGALGFKFGGTFTAVYKNYDLSPQLAAGFFDNEIMKVEPGANERDTAYWNTIRPMPLTVEEKVDYVVKDSIRIIRESKPYLDSMDRVENKLEWGDLLLGYTWRNSWKRQEFEVESPINTFQLNAVQGFNVFSLLAYRKAFDKGRNKNLEAKTRFSYGFSEKIFRASGDFSYRFDPKKFAQIRLAGGQEILQFNELEPISMLLNTNYMLFGRRHYARLYDKKFVKADYQQEITNGLLLYGLAQWAERSPLENHSDYSLFYRKSRDYEPNYPQGAPIEEPDLQTSRAFSAGISARIRLKQRYMDYPDRKYVLESKFPDLWLHYRLGVPAFGTEVEYHRLSFSITKDDIKLGLTGVTRLRLEAGRFLGKQQLPFFDFKHFLGNEANIANHARYLYSFKRLPYYEFSTQKSWAEAHFEHNFKGFLTDKVPGLKKLGLSLVAGANYLYTEEQGHYHEFSLGFDGIGVGIARLLRFDVVSSFRQGRYDGTGWLLGIVLPVDEFQL